jgi:hypothetical protein
MFEYAAGRSISLRLGSELKLDRDWLEGAGQTIPSPRQYELDAFNIKAERASTAEIAELESRSVGARDWLRIKLRRATTPVVYEAGHAFNSKFNVVSGDALLIGHWPSERYFQAHKEVIRQDFTYRRPATGANLSLLEQIGAGESVSVHVRRGDYLTDPQARGILGAQSPDYYARAFKIIEKQIKRPHYFIFSDDADWARKNLPVSDRTVTYVDHNTKGSEDLRLMQACRHHVIANSSFSWWGAWLGSNPKKLVVAPTRWFKDETIDERDIVPHSWARA